MHAPSSDALAAILSSFEKLTLFIFARCSFIDAFSATVVYPPSGSVHTLTAPSVPPEMNALSVSSATDCEMVDFDPIIAFVDGRPGIRDPDTGVLGLLAAVGIMLFGLAIISFGMYTVVTVLKTNSHVRDFVTAAVGGGGGLKSFNVDSCATVHVCNDASWFDTLTYQKIAANAVAEQPTIASGRGTVTFSPTTQEGLVVPIVLRDVLYIPRQTHNLVSCSRLEDAGFIHRSDLYQYRFGDYIFEYTRSGGVYPWSEAASIAAIRPLVPRDRADWQVLFSVFNDFAAPFTPSSSPRKHWFELFRNTGNEVCEQGHSLGDSAWNYDWAGRDNYANPVFEEQFINRTFDKALTDFAKDPSNTRFLIIVPEWKEASWWPLTKHFETIKRYPTGTVMFSAPGIGTTNHAALTPVGEDGSPNRFLIKGTPWPVVVLYKDSNTTTKADDNILLHLIFW